MSSLFIRGAAQPRFAPILACLAFALVACGDATGPGSAGVHFQYTFTDPVGDTMPPSPNTFARALDATTARVGMTEDSIFVRFEFTNDIAPWSSGQLNAIDGFVDFDVDDNAATGYPAAVEEFGHITADMGVEAYVSLRDDGQGHVMRRDGQAPDFRPIVIEFEARSFTLRLARTDIGEVDGVFRMSAMIGGTGRWISDNVPSNGHFRVVAP